MRSPIDVETQVGITLHYLSDEGRLRKKQQMHLVSLDLQCPLLYDKSVIHVIPPYTLALKYTTEENVQEKVKGFYDVYNFPQRIGAIDGTHMQILPCKHFKMIS